jgi:hypothetical protein
MTGRDFTGETVRAKRIELVDDAGNVVMGLVLAPGGDVVLRGGMN